MKDMRKEELNYMSAICCLLVIMIHVLSFAIVDLDKQSWQFAIIFFPWQISAFVVPAFLFCGATKLSMQINSDQVPPYTVYVKARTKKVYIPYVFATIIYFAVFSCLGFIEGSLKSLLGYLLLGNISAPLYYIIITMQFYLLFPIWKQVVLYVPPYIGIPSAAMLSLLMLRASSAISQFGFVLPYTDRMFPTYLYYWIIGLYVGRSYDDVCKALLERRKMVGASVSLVCVFSIISYIQYTENIYLYDTGCLKLFSDVISIFALLTICLRISNSDCKWLKNAIRQIHSASFFVYLYHCLFLEVGTVALKRSGVIQAEQLIFARGAICYTIPFFLYSAKAKAQRIISSKKSPPSLL